MRYFLISIAVLLITGCAEQEQSFVDLVIENVTVYSGEVHGPFVATVVIDDGNILEIASAGENEVQASHVIDGTGKFLTPGLWDVHVHTRSADDPADGLAMDSFVRAGVTSIHDMGGYADRIQALLESIEKGSLRSPTVYPAFFMLNGESFADFQHEVTTEEQVTKAVDQLVSLGARQIKIHRAFPPELLAFLVAYAGESGLVVAGHIPLGQHPLAACEAGMRSFHHIAAFIESHVSVAAEGEGGTRAAFEYMLSPESQPLYECLRRNDAWFAPTLATYESIARARVGDGEMPQEFVDFLAANSALAMKMHEEGIGLLAGTDTSDYSGDSSPVAGIALLDELELLEAAGIPAHDVIYIATSNAAKAIGVYDQVGSIAVGKRADLLLLSSDPGSGVAAFRRVELVIQDGKVHRGP